MNTTMATMAKAMLAGVALVALLGSAPARAESLTASLERNPIHAGESVRLVLELARAAGGLKPDLAPLEEDFQILHTSANTQIEFVQGLQSAITRWTIELTPKREGVLTVPVISVGQFQSKPLSLEVREPRPGNQADSRDIFLEAEVSPDPAYVQAQMRYIVRLLRSLDVVDGTLTEPTATNAVLRRLGRDISYTTTRDGQAYRVLERRYAVFPQRSGELVISPVEFEGEVVDPAQAGTGLSRLFTRGKRVRLRTPVVRATALAPPAEFPGNTWLPASNLELTEEWSKDPQTLLAGEPVTRTLRLQGVGLSAEQLPEIRVNVNDDVKEYSDQPITRTTTDTDWVRGVREQRVALVPGHEGRYLLPEIRIDWWDTQRDAPRQAVIAAREIRVAAGMQNNREASPVDDALPSVPQPVAPVWQRPRPWQILCVLLAAAWLATIIAWRRARDGPRPSARARDAQADAPARGPDALRRACLAGDAHGARTALLAWAAGRWPEDAPHSLPALADRLADAALRAELAVLDRSLYASGQDAWQGQSLWKLARHGLVQAAPKARRRRDHLPMLYPP
jgi:hypothetical protein